MKTIEELWNDFKDVPYPKSTHQYEFDLVEADAALAGMIQTHIAGGEINIEQVWHYIDEITLAMPDLDADSRTYFQKVVDISEHMIDDKVPVNDGLNLADMFKNYRRLLKREQIENSYPAYLIPIAFTGLRWMRLQLRK